MDIKCIWCDNAGENIKLQKRADSTNWKLSLTFEFTAQELLQQNHLEELGFAMLYKKGCAMLIAANAPDELRYKLSGEAFRKATLLDGLVGWNLVANFSPGISTGAGRTLTFLST